MERKRLQQRMERLQLMVMKRLQQRMEMMVVGVMAMGQRMVKRGREPWRPPRMPQIPGIYC
jgi:hypothetical protein